MCKNFDKGWFVLRMANIEKKLVLTKSKCYGLIEPWKFSRVVWKFPLRIYFMTVNFMDLVRESIITITRKLKFCLIGFLATLLLPLIDKNWFLVNLPLNCMHSLWIGPRHFNKVISGTAFKSRHVILVLFFPIRFTCKKVRVGKWFDA